MKPLTFDMTPLAKALEMPRTQSPTTTQKQLPARPRKEIQAKRSPDPDRRAVFPRPLAEATGWISKLAREQTHALATHVLARHTERGLRVLAVTSALAGEGKTTISLSLAERIASAGRKVLLVDLDTHRATLSRDAELGDASGALESAQTDTEGDSQALNAYPTGIEGVSIMPTGRLGMDGEAAPLLDPQRIHRIARRGLEKHDLVILDCPPLLPVADTHVIGDIADSAILVIRAASTPREILEQTLEQFGKEKFFAAVLNRARPQHIPYFREVYGYYRHDSATR